MEPPRTGLPDHTQVDLWYTWTTPLAQQTRLLERYGAWLSPDEHIQASRYRVERARQEYLIGRALARAVLSQYTGTPPHTWVFTENPHGKPAIQSPENPALRFNLSHSTGLVVCAVACGREIGVDVEHVGRKVDCLALARRYFAAEESAALERLTPDAQPDAFFDLWTLKEAYAKACGRGLSVGLDRVVFSLEAVGPPRARRLPEPAEDPGAWQFARLRMARTYRIALAVQSHGCPRLALRAWETVPDAWIGPGALLEPNEANSWILACQSPEQGTG